MRGDGFRLRHDGIKMKIKSLLQWAGVRAKCGVFNEFAGLIPQQGLNRAVDRRAAGLTADYLRKARNIDQQYCGTPAPPPGPGNQQQPRAIGVWGGARMVLWCVLGSQ